MTRAAKHCAALLGCLLLGARAESLRDLLDEAERIPELRQTSDEWHKSEEESDAGCVWPKCVKRCDVCEHKRVGTCIGKSIGLQVPGCYSARADCVLTRCVCQKDMCASPFDNRTCVPTTCHEGARPNPPPLSGFARFFAAMTTADDDEIRHSWQETGDLLSMVTKSSAGLFLTILLGLFVAAMTGVRLIHDTFVPCIASHRNRRRKKLQQALDVDMSESSTLTRMLTIEEDPVEPSYWPMIVLGAVINVICIAGIVIRFHISGKLFGIIEWQVVHAARNAHTLAQLASRLNKTSVDMHSTLAGLPDACSSNALLAEIAGVGADSMTHYVNEISHYASVIEPMPIHLLRLTNKIHSERGAYAKMPMVPLIVMGVLAVGIVLEALYIRFHRSKGHAIRRMDRWIVPKAFIYALIIFVVAVFIAMEIAVAIGVGAVCVNVDEFVLKVIEFQTIANGVNSTDPYNTARFYILGDVYNPLATYTKDAKLYIDQLDDIYGSLTPLVNATALSCPELNELDIDGVRNEAHDILRHSQRLLSAENVYPYYDQLVHEGLCDVMPDSLGMMLIFQIVIGLILFPIHTIVTHKFLSQTASWLKSLKDKEDESSEEESSDDDGSDGGSPRSAPRP